MMKCLLRLQVVPDQQRTVADGDFRRRAGKGIADAEGEGGGERVAGQRVIEPLQRDAARLAAAKKLAAGTRKILVELGFKKADVAVRLAETPAIL